MRIAFVSQPFDRLNPGIQNSLGLWTYQIARRLSGRAQVTVYMAQNQLHRQIADHDGVRFRMVPIPIDRRVVRLVESANRRLGIGPPPFLLPFYFLEYALRVSLDLRRDPHDIVHTYNFPYLASLVKAFNPAARVVLNMTSEWLARRLPIPAEKGLQSIDLLLGRSRHITRGLIMAHPSLSRCCRIVYNGTEISGTTKSGRKEEDVLRVLFVGRISPEKGIHVLIDAFRAVADEYPEAFLELIGGGRSLPRESLIDLSTDPAVRELSRFYQDHGPTHYAQTLRNRIQQLGLEDCIQMTGFLSHDEVLMHCSRADVLVNPSFSESFGIPIIEAMAAGTPVVASRVGGMMETVIDGRTGYLVEKGNPEALAEAIMALLSDPHLRRRMGKNGQKRLGRRFTWQIISERVFELWRELVEGHD